MPLKTTKRRKTAKVGKQEKLHPLTLKISERIRTFAWPKGADQTVTEAVDRSLKNYDKFAKQIETIDYASPRLMRFLGWLSPQLHSREDMMVTYFQWIWQSFSWRRDFSGDLRKYVWTVASYRPEGLTWAREYCGDSSLWDKLVGDLNLE